LTYTLNPLVYYAENRSLTLPENATGKSPFSYPYLYNLDWVQRFGGSAFTEFHIGQSEVKLSNELFAVALSTQNMTWGPAYENPILMSNNAGGFPHIRIGTNLPTQTVIGTVEIQSFWGRLQESDYFDNNPSNDRRFLTGLTASYKPRFSKNLIIGFQRVLYRNWKPGDLEIRDFLAAFANFSPERDEEVEPGRITNDFYDQIASVYLKWQFPEVGFETYIEYAKNDYPASFQELMRQPDRQRAYNIGFIKVFDIDRFRLLRLAVETTTLSQNQSRLINISPMASFYIHDLVRQGYTHNGQLMGASIGPGSNSNFISLDYYYAGGLVGAYFQRTRYNDDYTLSTFVGDITYVAEFDINLGARFVMHFKKISVLGDLSFSYINNWFFDPTLSTWNISPVIQIRYKF
jgi:hypothetical protein